MANNYTEFSFVIQLDTPEKLDWAQRAVAYLRSADSAENIERLRALASDPDGLTSSGTLAEPNEFDVLLRDDFLDFEYVGFGFEVDGDDDTLWINSGDESGDVDAVVPLVRGFLHACDPNGGIGFEWADYCSKLRVGEQGGGAIWITANDVEWLSTGRWLNEKETEHAARWSPEPATS